MERPACEALMHIQGFGKTKNAIKELSAYLGNTSH